MTPARLRVAARTVAKMVDKVARLDEQGATASRLDRYLHHWGQWVRAGLGDRLVPGPLDEGLALTYLKSLGYIHNIAGKLIHPRPWRCPIPRRLCPPLIPKPLIKKYG